MEKGADNVMNGTEDHSQRLGYRHAYGGSWLGVQLYSNPTITPVHGTDNDDDF